MLTITLKARHLRLIAFLLKNIIANDVFRVLNEIKTKLSSDALDDDDVTLNVARTEIEFVYPLLSELSEGMVAEINKEMDHMLLPQVATGIESEGETPGDWTTLYQFILNHKARMAGQLQLRIDQGKSFLGI